MLRDVWGAKFYMIGFACVFFVFALLFTSFAQRYYRAEMLIMPASLMGGDLGMSSSQGTEGTIQVQRESLQSDVAFTRFSYIYDGVSVAGVLAKDENVLAALSFDRTFEFSKAKTDWTAETLSDYLKQRVVLEPVSGTPLRRLIYLHPNKDFALAMVSRIHRIADEIIRARMLRDVKERIDYLNQSLTSTQNPEHRRSLVALLMEQERMKMLVSLDQSFSAAIVEPPSVSAKPVWPDPYFVYPVFILIGFFLGFVVHGMRHYGR